MLLFFVGVLSTVVQGGLLGRLVKRFGEERLALPPSAATCSCRPPTGSRRGLDDVSHPLQQFPHLHRGTFDPRRGVEIHGADRAGCNLGRHAVDQQSCRGRRSFDRGSDPRIDVSSLPPTDVRVGAHFFFCAAFNLAAFLLAWRRLSRPASRRGNDPRFDARGCNRRVWRQDPASCHSACRTVPRAGAHHSRNSGGDALQPRARGVLRLVRADILSGDTLRWILAVSFLAMAIWTLQTDKLDKPPATLRQAWRLLGDPHRLLHHRDRRQDADGDHRARGALPERCRGDHRNHARHDDRQYPRGLFGRNGGAQACRSSGCAGSRREYCSLWPSRRHSISAGCSRLWRCVRVCVARCQAR